MALEDVLAGLPVRGEYLAQQAFDQRQAIGLASMLRQAQQMRLEQAQEQRLREMAPLQMDMLRAQIARQQQDTQLRQEADARQRNALTDLEGFLNQKYPGGPEVGLFRAAAALDPRDAGNMALTLAGMKGANAVRGVDPMEVRRAEAHARLLREADQAESAGDTATAQQKRAYAENIKRVMEFEAERGTRANRDLDRKEAQLYDVTGMRPTPAPRPQQSAPQAGEIQFPSSGRATSPAQVALQQEAGTAGDMSSESALRGAMGAPAPAGVPLSPKALRDIDVSRQKEMLQLNAKQYQDFRAKLPELNASVRALTKLKELNEQGEAFTNAGATFKAQLSSIAQALGVEINVDRLSSSELYQAQVAELLKARLASKDYGSGNAISNLDLVAAKEPLPDLVRSREGQRKIIDALTQDAVEKRDDINAYRTHFDRNRGNMEGFTFPSEAKTDERLKALQSARPAQSGGPQPGFTKGGYRFKGGDPARRENWEKM